MTAVAERLDNTRVLHQWQNRDGIPIISSFHPNLVIAATIAFARPDSGIQMYSDEAGICTSYAIEEKGEVLFNAARALPGCKTIYQVVHGTSRPTTIPDGWTEEEVKKTDALYLANKIEYYTQWKKQVPSTNRALKVWLRARIRELRGEEYKLRGVQPLTEEEIIPLMVHEVETYLAKTD